MTGETEILVLERLPGMWGEMGAFRSEMEKRLSAVETSLTSVEERLDAIDTHLEGIRHALVASNGSAVVDLKNPEARVAAFEGMPA